MIKINKLNKIYNTQHVLKDINLEFPKSGLITIAGPSGSGKSTLLNAIAGLIDFDGSIKIDKFAYFALSEEDKCSYRLKNIGFVFQDFKLFENETIMDNVLLPLTSISTLSNNEKKRKLIDVLEIVNLDKKPNLNIKKLSGGQKQKVAIGRAIINNPKILLCDEPTGALDSKSKVEIMSILKKISNKKLVIVVSHDLKLAKEFSDRIITLKDGYVVDDRSYLQINDDNNILIKQNKKFSKKQRLSFGFILSHIFHKFKNKKYRSSICVTAMSVGLLTLGFSINLSTSISSNIKESFASIIDEKRVIISNKNQEANQTSRMAASEDEVLKIYNQHGENFTKYGVNYIADYESFFKDVNEVILSDTINQISLKGLNIRSCNEFRLMSDKIADSYPYEFKSLKNNEVVCSLTIDMINSICYEHKIERSVESLRNYLKLNTIGLAINIENFNWRYSFSIPLKMVGFTLEDKTAFYHTNPFWNTYIFEEEMNFPVSQNITGVLSKPWTLRKAYYLEFKEDKKDDFLSFSLEDFELNKFIFEPALETYFPYRKFNLTSKYNNRFMVFQNTLTGVNSYYSKYIQDTYKELSSPIYSSYGGYYIYPEILLSGFANTSYLSSKIDLIEKVIDSETSLNENDSISKIPTGILSLHYSKSMDGGVIFNPISQSAKINGDFPTNYDEIVISSYLSNQLFEEIDTVGKELYLTSCINEINNDKSTKKFVTKSLKIVGVIDSNSLSIFHKSDWSLLFFLTRLEISRFALDCNSISFELTNKQLKGDFVEKFNNKTSPFPSLIASDPLKSVNTGVDEVCYYLEFALLGFSLLAIIISILILVMTNYLFIIENKKEFGLFTCLGISKKECRKFLIINSVFYCFVAMTLSSIELITSVLFVNIEISSLLGGNLNLIFNPLAILIMFLVSLCVSLFSSFVYLRKIDKISPLEALKH